MGNQLIRRIYLYFRYLLTTTMAAKKKRPTTVVTNSGYCVSTAASDFVLLLSCVYGIWKMFLENLNNLNKVFLHGYIWFGLCGAAAALGVVRFGKKQLPETVRKAHQLASWLTGTIGMANLAAQYFIHNYKIAFIGNIHFATCALSVVSFFSRREAAMDLARQVASLVAIISILLGGLLIGEGNLYAVAGALLVIISSPFVRDGDLGGVPYVDIFHYILTLANIMFLQGMVTDTWDMPRLQFWK